MRCSAALLFFFLVPLSLLGQADEVEGPWGTHNGDIAGTSSTQAIPYALGTGPIREAWRLDVRAEGQDRVAGRNPITFDAEGNIYWKSSIGGGTGGITRIVSAGPGGSIRWFGNEGAGVVHGLGGFFDGTAVVVGRNAVYAVGGLVDGTFIAAAYRKDSGELIWDTPLDDTNAAATGTPPSALLFTPVLFNGKLYVVAPDLQTFLDTGTSIPRNVHRIDAATGAVDWMDTIPEITISMEGSMTFVPDAFGPGEHGLYFNGTSGRPPDGIPDVYALKITAAGAELAWSAEGGFVARSHLIFSGLTRTLYAHTWTDSGAELYTYDPVSRFLNANQNTPDTGHGFYDVGCLEFNGTEIIAGGFQGLVIRYREEGGGLTSNSVAFDDTYMSGTFYGEYRVFGQLLKGPDGHSVLISGTNSDTASPFPDGDPTFTARVVAIDVTSGCLLWEYDTLIVQNHGFTVRGGPYAGPDGKVYYFDAISGELVALESTPPPLLGACEVTDARCEVTPQGVRVTWTSDTDANDDCIPECACERFEIRRQGGGVLAQLPGDASGATLETACAEDPQGTVSIVCVGPDASEKQASCSYDCPLPACAVTDVSCVAVGEDVRVTWSADTDTNDDGQADCACERFELRRQEGGILAQLPADTHEVLLGGACEEVTKGMACVVCIGEDGSERQTCCNYECTPAGIGPFLRGDCNSDGRVSGTVTDAVFMLNFNFLGGTAPLCIAACDANADGAFRGTVTDAVYTLNFNFLGGPAPPEPYPDCGSSSRPGDVNHGCEVSPEACRT